MTVQKKFTWFHAIGFFWGLIGILCVVPALFFTAFFDRSTGSQFMDHLFIYGMLSFPIVSFMMGIIVILLGRKHKTLALFASVIPLLPVLPIIFLFTMQSVGLGDFVICGASECPTPPVQTPITATTIKISPCTQTLPDFSDGFPTTGCGIIDYVNHFTGTINSTSEAQNWELLVVSNPGSRIFRISLESDGKSCPQMSVFDYNGHLINGFPQDNKTDSCLTYPHIYSFSLPAVDSGIYVLRITMPVTPGSYWIMTN